jgi:hypothetical protein
MPGRFRAAWIKDPDGNTIALTEASGYTPPRLSAFQTQAGAPAITRGMTAPDDLHLSSLTTGSPLLAGECRSQSS